MSLNNFPKFLIVLGMSFFLYACSDNNEPIVEAVASSDRLESDKARDVDRKPVDVLTFFGVKPGMQVIDVFSGGGYYTQILDHIVGPTGNVIAHNNQGYKNFAKDELAKRYGEGKLLNTVQYWAEANELSFEPESADLVVIMLGIHDVYYKPKDQSWPTIDEDRFYNSIINSLKVGGVLGVVDHMAEAGADKSTGHTIHRIDPAIIIRELTARGLVLDASSDMLLNPADPLTTSMWGAEIKGHTSRFVLRFVKPASTAATTIEPVEMSEDVVMEESVLNSALRGEDEKARDLNRKPLEVLSFFDVDEGMTVLDMHSSTGYYTKILSAVVGDEGMVIAHTSPRTSAERQAEMGEIYATLDNVNYLVSPVAELPLKDNSVDRALLFLMYHHMHYNADSGDQVPAATAATLAEIKRVLRPDGVFALIEHKALNGINRVETSALHRVSSDIAEADLLINGFTLIKQSDLLANFDDAMDCHFRECAERGKTNRIVHYYQPIN